VVFIEVARVLGRQSINGNRDGPFIGKDYFAIDSFLYYGTDDRYLSYLVQFIKPGGFIGVVDIAFTRDVRSIEDAPEYLRPQYQKHWSYVHTVEPKVTISCAIMRGTGRRSRMKTRLCGPCRKIATD
jgi:hypothetical protein